MRATVVGVDIGSSAIMIAVAHHRGGLVTVTKLLRMPTPPGAFPVGGDLDPAALGAAVRDALLAAKVPKRSVLVASLGGAPVVVERMVVESGSPAEINAQVQPRALAELPFEPNETMYAYIPLRATIGSGVPVLVVAVKAAAAAAWKSLVAALGAPGSLGRLDIHSFALHNALHLALPGVRGPAMQLHLGERLCSVILLDDAGDVLAARDLPRGLATLRARLTDATGANDTDLDARWNLPRGLAPEQAALEDWAADLAAECALLWRGTGILGTQRPLYISGGGSLIPDVVSAVADALQSSGVERIDVLTPLGVSDAALQAPLSPATANAFGLLAVGLALRDDAPAALAKRGK